MQQATKRSADRADTGNVERISSCDVRPCSSIEIHRRFGEEQNSACRLLFITSCLVIRNVGVTLPNFKALYPPTTALFIIKPNATALKLSPVAILHDLILPFWGGGALIHDQKILLYSLCFSVLSLF
jgi:hypothetical protein